MARDIKILVVDDDRYLLDLLLETLKTIGYDTIGASGAQEALALLETTPIDLVITDIRMPGMDGVEFARRVKNTRPDLPVIFITGVFSSSILQKVDAQGFLAKPFRIGQIEELIEEVMGRSNITDQSPPPDRVLVVDDDETFRLMLMETLKLCGYNVAGSADGRTAIAALEQGHISAVITDVKMPGMDGISLAKSIRDKWPEIPIVMITGYLPAEDLSLESAGVVDGFLMKPFKIESITELLESLKQRTPPVV